MNIPQKVRFSRASGGGLRHYYINGEPYDPESKDYILELSSEPNTRKFRISRRTFLGTGIAAATATLISLDQAIARLTTSKFPAPQPYKYTEFRNPIEFAGKDFWHSKNLLVTHSLKL
ncbi:hypothetical protein [Okeania sp. KiyG1]|uniref:hypothetical protein n=1 Tax=Okeania sp. KiyG1 TaxID=2720165 RepID=UPI001920913A|nr:hypothetical protein [Okeania sp. KiyG1]GGA24019.1 hypothetical protein CYANOKiyG1_39480 [Okeania sp. KiyG1]